MTCNWPLGIKPNTVDALSAASTSPSLILMEMAIVTFSSRPSVCVLKSEGERSNLAIVNEQAVRQDITADQCLNALHEQLRLGHCYRPQRQTQVWVPQNKADVVLVGRVGLSARGWRQHCHNTGRCKAQRFWY